MTPQSVTLDYRQDRDTRHLQVRVHDLATGEMLACDTAAATAVWLDVFGYRWVVGSNGVWSK